MPQLCSPYVQSSSGEEALSDRVRRRRPRTEEHPNREVAVCTSKVSIGRLNTLLSDSNRISSKGGIEQLSPTSSAICKAEINYLDEIPSVILALIESYLNPKSLVTLSMTCTKFYKRWTTIRWRKTFDLHYSITRRPECSNKNSCSSSQPCEKMSVSLCSSEAIKPSMPPFKSRYRKFYIDRYGSWEQSFVCEGGDVDDCFYDEDKAAKTTFNHNSLLPSLKHYYKSLWCKIELSMLGLEIPSANDAIHGDVFFRNLEHGRNQFFDETIRHRNYHVPRQRRHNFTAFSVVAKVIQMLFSPLIEYIAIVLFSNSNFFGLRARRYCRSKEGIRLLDINSNGKKVGENTCYKKGFEHAWKLACLLKEGGINCICCRLCDEIDVVGNNKSDIVAWITPCLCLEPVHRKCLEEKLGLVQSIYILEKWRLVTKEIRSIFCGCNDDSNIIQLSPKVLTPKMWVSYDSPIPDYDGQINGSASRNPVQVDEDNKFTSSLAKCSKCGVQFSRALRLPRTIPEIVFASLSDRLAVLRAISTLLHFLLCIGFIAALEGKYADREGISYNLIDVSPFSSFTLKWPSSIWKGIALAWWQLQQCCMLHIFFSARFVAIVDRLWGHSGSTFYVKLYVYFVCSTFLLMFFIPSISRKVEKDLLSKIMSKPMMEYLSPAWDLVLFCNLIQYAVSSTTVIIIFWRTHYRMFTVAGRNDSNCLSSPLQLRHVDLESDNTVRQVNLAIDHPIYHGRWQS